MSQSRASATENRSSLLSQQLQAVTITPETFQSTASALVGKINHSGNDSGLVITADDLHGKKAKIFFALCQGYPSSLDGKKLSDIAISSMAGFDEMFGAGNWSYEFLFHHNTKTTQAAFENENEELLNSPLFKGKWYTIEAYRKTAAWQNLKKLVADLPSDKKAELDKALEEDAKKECARKNQKCQEEGQVPSYNVEDMTAYLLEITIDYLSFMPRRTDKDLLTVLLTPHSYKLASWRKVTESCKFLDSRPGMFAPVQLKTKPLQNRAVSAPVVSTKPLYGSHDNDGGRPVKPAYNVHPNGYLSNDEAATSDAMKDTEKVMVTAEDKVKVMDVRTVIKDLSSAAAIHIALSNAHTPQVNAHNAAKVLLNSMQDIPGLAATAPAVPAPAATPAPLLSPKNSGRGAPRKIVLKPKRRSLDGTENAGSPPDSPHRLSTSPVSSSVVALFHHNSNVAAINALSSKSAATSVAASVVVAAL